MKNKSLKHKPELHEIFEKHDGEFLKFDRILQKHSNRPDVHAFILLDKLVPGAGRIIGYAEHDEIGLSIELAELAKAATEEQIIELIRCGVTLSTDGSGDYVLKKFV